MSSVPAQPRHPPPPPSTVGGKQREKEEAEEEKEKRERQRECCKRALRFTLSQLGLIVSVTIYAAVGGLVFQHLEETNEKEQCVEMMDQYVPMENATVNKILAISGGFSGPDDASFAMQAYRKQLTQFRDSVLLLGYTGVNCTTMGEPNGTPYQWSYPAALLFATTIFTTVGYGNIAPKTFWGRLVCIAYAVLGIPLMLLVLANIGEIMANVFRYVYINVCCCGFLQKRSRTQQQQQQQASTTAAPMDAWKNQYNAQKSGAQVVDDDDDDDDEDEEEKASVPLTVSLALVAVYVFVGALLFGVWSELDWLAGAYFCFITIATIGFGDIVPGTQTLGTTSGRLQLIGTAVYMVFGMAILSMAFNLIQDEIVSKFRWLGEKLGLIKPDEEDDHPNPQPMPPRPVPPMNAGPQPQGPQIFTAPGLKQQGPPPPPFYSQLKAPPPPSSEIIGPGRVPGQPSSYPGRYMP